MNRRDLLLGSIASLTMLDKAEALSRTQRALLQSNGVNSTTWVPGQRPFAASSPVNQPLPANQIYVPAQWPISTGSNYFSTVKFYFDIPEPGAPIVTMTNVEQGWGHAAGDVLNVPMTPGFTFTELSDQEGISIINNICWSWYDFTRITDHVATLGIYANCDIHGSGFGSLVPSHSPDGLIGAGVVATGSSCLLGALVKEEFTAGEILHWVSFVTVGQGAGLVNGATTPNYYPPAINGDGLSPNGFIMEGQIMAIPVGTTMPAGLSVYGQKLFRAMRDYGAFCNDSAGSTGFYLAENYNNVPTSWSNADLALIQTDTALLCPLLMKVGFWFDGFQISGPYALCGPQLSNVGYRTGFGTTGNDMLVTRDSDSTSLGIGFAGPTSSLPDSLLNSSALTTFCSGTTGRVSTYYNQTLQKDFASAGANAPIIYQSGALKAINGVPAVAFDGSTNYLKATGSSASFPSTNMFLNAVVQISDYLANYGIIGGAAAGGLELRIDQTTGFVRLLQNGGSTIALASVQIPLNAPVIISAHYNLAGSFVISINATQVVNGSATFIPVNNGDIQIGAGGPAGTELFKGLIGQWVICNNMGAITQYSIEQYQKTFWGPLGAAILAQDGFVDTNGTDLAAHTMTIGAGWTDQIGTHFIQSNSGQPNTLVSAQAISTFAANANGVYTCTLTPYWSGVFNAFTPVMLFRYTDSNNYMQLVFNAPTNAVVLYQIVAGTPTILTTLSLTIVSGTSYVVAITFSGTAISFTVNGANLTSASSGANLAATLAGIKSVSQGSPPTKCSYNTLSFTI